MATQQQWGVTPAFSADPPTEQDTALNTKLIAELKAQNNFAPPSDVERREAVIKKLEGLLRQMVQIVGKKQGLPAGILDGAGGKIMTYGSFRLGVYGPNSDVDTLMVAPKFVSREDFFELMPDLLRQSSAPDEITEMVSVPGIGTPIIKLCIQEVDIDLIFASIQQLQTIPADLNLADDNLLRGLDPTDVKCVNGARVTNKILDVVPQTKTFRLALRTIKLWAQRRAIYGNIVGFPGGVAWAILVARICQLYPKAVAPLLVMKFFFIMRKWNWPRPVFLLKQESTPLQLREWDPKSYRGDQAHLMPILTPSYPTQNTAHTVSPSTMKVLMSELERGEKIVEEIYTSGRPWKDLFEKHHFFTDAYKHYICVVTGANTKDAHDAWAGLVESKIKRLVTGIELSDAQSVELVQPFNKGFQRVHECKDQKQVEETLDGSSAYKIAKTKTEETADVKTQVAAQADTNGEAVPDAVLGDDAKPKESWPKKVYTTTYYLGIGLQRGATNLDISMPVRNFNADCTGWLNYDKEKHSIKIKHIRNYDLPDDVFAAGETRPTRPKKKPKAVNGTAEPAANKRSFTDTGFDENAASAKRRQSANGPSATTNGIAAPNGTAT